MEWMPANVFFERGAMRPDSEMLRIVRGTRLAERIVANVHHVEGGGECATPGCSNPVGSNRGRASYCLDCSRARDRKRNAARRR